MVLGGIKKSIIALLLIIVVVIGGRAGGNYYKYGDIRGKEYETEENKGKKIEEQLQSGLERLQRKDIDLGEANEVFQEINKMSIFGDENIPPKIVEKINKALSIFSVIFKDFVEKVFKDEIKLSDLEEEKFKVVIEVKVEAKKIYLFFSKDGNLEEKQEVESKFNLLEEKIEEERNKRANGGRSKFGEIYEFDKILEFRNDPDLLEKKGVDENLLTHRDVKNWLDIGIRPKEYDFVRGIREVKSQQYSTEEIQTSFKDPKGLKNNVVLDDLRREFKESKSI